MCKRHAFSGFPLSNSSPILLKAESILVLIEGLADSLVCELFCVGASGLEQPKQTIRKMEARDLGIIIEVTQQKVCQCNNPTESNLHR